MENPDIFLCSEVSTLLLILSYSFRMVLLVKTLSAVAFIEKLKYLNTVVVVLRLVRFLIPDFILSHIAFVKSSFCLAET